MRSVFELGLRGGCSGRGGCVRGRGCKLRRRAGQSRMGCRCDFRTLRSSLSKGEARRGEANPVKGLGEGSASASPVWGFEGLCPGAASSSNHDTLFPPSSHPLLHSRALLRIELSRHWPGAALPAPTVQDAPSPIASRPAVLDFRSENPISIGCGAISRAKTLALDQLPEAAKRWSVGRKCSPKILGQSRGTQTPYELNHPPSSPQHPSPSLSVAGSHCLATCRTPTSPR